MNVTLKEWNDLCDLAQSTCEALNSKGCNVKFRPYYTSDGNRSIEFFVFDKFDNYFTNYYVGIGTYNEIKHLMRQTANRIMIECLR